MTPSSCHISSTSWSCLLVDSQPVCTSHLGCHCFACNMLSQWFVSSSLVFINLRGRLGRYHPPPLSQPKCSTYAGHLYLHRMYPKESRDFTRDLPASFCFLSKPPLFIHIHTMDDGIELNFAPSSSSVRQVSNKKGGRWTDRYVHHYMI